MKPDGVVTAAQEPVETLESNPLNEAEPAGVQEPNQATNAGEGVTPQQSAEAALAQPDLTKDTLAAKMSSKASGERKASPSSKALLKSKPNIGSAGKSAAAPGKMTPSTRPNTTQSRLSNGTSKPPTNGVAPKKAPSTAAVAKKSTPTSAVTKTATSSTTPKTKVAEKKTTLSAANGVKTSGSTAATKSPSTNSSTAAKKPPAARLNTASSKPDSTSSKPSASKTTRPTAGTTASSQSAAALVRPPTNGKSAAGKPAAPKASTTSARPAAAKPTSATPKPTSATPSGGKAPTSQTSRNTTPLKKDVTKPTTPASKKPVATPNSRPSSAVKAKPDTPKSDVTAKKPLTSKAADTKTPTRPKTQDIKTTSKDSSKTPSTKAPTNKNAAPKKPVGSSTPTPVKRGPKATTVVEPEKDIAAAVAAAAAIAAASAAISKSEEPQPPAEPVVESSAVTETISAQEVQASVPEPVQEQVQEPLKEATPELDREIKPEPVREPTPEPLREPTPEPLREPTPEPLREPTPEPLGEPTPKPLREPTPEPVREPTPEPLREPTPEPLREPTPEPLREPTPEPMREPTPEPIRVPTPEPPREPTPEPLRELTPEPLREPTPEPLREPTPEPLREPTPEPVREPTPDPVRESTPEPFRESTPELAREPSAMNIQEQTTENQYNRDQFQEMMPESSFETPPRATFEHNEAATDFQLPAQPDFFKCDESANNSVPSLGTTVLSPPCSPPGCVSPSREPEMAASLLGSDPQSNFWNRDETQSQDNALHYTEDSKDQFEAQETMEEDEDVEEKESLFMPSSTAPSVGVFGAMAEPYLLGAPAMGEFTVKPPLFAEKEEAVEKADEEINEDVEDDEDEEDEEDDEDQRRIGHQPSSMVTDMSSSQPSEEFQVRSSAFGGSSGWLGDDPLSGMDSEDVSSCASSRQQGVSDLSSTQHTAILEGTQSSDALVDSSFRGSEGDCNLMGSPNVETLANEEEDDDDDDEDHRVDEMDLSSERVEEHTKAFQQHEHVDDEDEDIEMCSEGVTESCDNAEDDEDFNEEERFDDMGRSGPCAALHTSWGQTQSVSKPWTEPAALQSVSPYSPVSHHGVLESETLAIGQTHFDSFSPLSHTKEELDHHHLDHIDHKETKSADPEEDRDLLVAPGESETSTPEDLRDYDSSSGVESRSEKQQTPVPASAQPDLEQDLGIHLEKGDGEEEEAETLPADELLGTGPPTAPASATSSPSTSGDEASDTEGEMQISYPAAESKGFGSPIPAAAAHDLPALEEDEEVGDGGYAAATAATESEEDGGGATPQSANSVASYGFDCTTSNSNAHSVAESCGKSPGIFSLENEEQLPEEAKDPSLIKELTLPVAAAQSAFGDEELLLLGRHVDLTPLGHGDEIQPDLAEHHYTSAGKAVPSTGEQSPEVKALEPGHHLLAQGAGEGSDSQPPYYSTLCDKTDSFLAGDEKGKEVDGEHERLCSNEDSRNHNHAVPLANGHYLALVPGNRRPIDPTLAAHFANMSPSADGNVHRRAGGEQLKRLEEHQDKLREMQQRQEQEKQKRQWLEDERLRLEQQKQLEKQRRELLQLQLQQQQQEHRHRRQVLQWQLELEQQYRMQQKQIQQQQQLRRSPTGVMLSPSSGLCTIYEAMETSDEEDETRGSREERNKNMQLAGKRASSAQRQLCPAPPQELEWNRKVDVVQQLINQTLMLSGDGGCPPLLLLPVGSGGTLSPLESSMWPNLLPQFRPPAATVTSVSSYSPDSQGSSPPGDWTVVEVETQH